MCPFLNITEKYSQLHALICSVISYPGCNLRICL